MVGREKTLQFALEKSKRLREHFRKLGRRRAPKRKVLKQATTHLARTRATSRRNPARQATHNRLRRPPRQPSNHNGGTCTTSAGRPPPQPHPTSSAL